MRSLSFFTGAGGLMLGVERAGFESMTACEVPSGYRKPHQSRSKARHTIALNKPGMFVWEGIESYTYPSEHYGVDLIEGGPPCQAFSVAGKRGGIADIRGRLLMDFAALIRELRPKTFILENVPGLMSTDDGKVLDQIQSLFYKGGYHVRENIVDAQNFGVAQRRKRLILVGALAGMPEPMRPTVPWPRTLYEEIGDLQSVPMESLPASPCVWEAIAKGKGSRLKWDAVTPTLVTNLTGQRRGVTWVHPSEDRVLSVEECKRLQGFPDDWQLAGSARDKYTQLGNACPVPLAYAAALTAKKFLN